MKIKIISTAVSAAMMCGIMAQLGVAAINESPYDVTEVYLNHYDNIETSVFEPQLMNGSLTYTNLLSTYRLFCKCIPLVSMESLLFPGLLFILFNSL